jgi:hypothetical protein
MLSSITYFTGLDKDTSADIYVPEDGFVVDAFMYNNVGNGPTEAPSQLRFDFRPGAVFEEGWNLQCINIIVHHIIASLNLIPDMLRPTMPANAEIYFRLATTTKIRTYHWFYKQSCPCRLPNGQDETPAQVIACIAKTRNETNELNKRSGRIASVSESSCWCVSHAHVLA